MTTPPGYSGEGPDTEGVSGNTGAASRGTQYQASNTDTSNTSAASGPYTPDINPPVTGTTDTEGIGTGANGPYVPTPPPLLTGTVDTQTLGWPLTPGVTQPYRPPTQGIGYMSSEADTTWTDRPISDGSNRPDYVQNMSGTLESGNIGAIGPVSALVPVAPAGTPTVAAGPRQVTVTWATVADPDSTAPVLGYVVIGSTGGTTYAPRNATSVVVTNLVPDQQYTFKVLARNRNGEGPLGTASAAVQPYNPDEPDVGKPGGLDPYWKQNPIYNPDGTVKAGSGTLGTPGTPTGVTLANDGVPTAGKLIATWTAPASGPKVVSYTVTLSSGQTQTGIASTTTTATFTGLTTGTATTARVTAVGTVGSTQSAASSSVNVP